METKKLSRKSNLNKFENLSIEIAGKEKCKFIDKQIAR